MLLKGRYLELRGASGVPIRGALLSTLTHVFCLLACFLDVSGWSPPEPEMSSKPWIMLAIPPTVSVGRAEAGLNSLRGLRNSPAYEPGSDSQNSRYPWVFGRDDSQHLPIVLARWQGSLVFGRADKPETYQVKLSGPGFRSMKVLSAPIAVKDSGYFDIALVEADRWGFIGRARKRCEQCGQLPNVWALFPFELRAKLMSRLGEARREASESDQLIVWFDSRDSDGISITVVRAGT